MVVSVYVRALKVLLRGEITFAWVMQVGLVLVLWCKVGELLVWALGLDLCKFCRLWEGFSGLP